MAIFTNNSINENNTTTDVLNSADIVYEFSEAINKTISALYVSDIILETVTDNNNDISILSETTIKDAISNAANAISTFMKRIIEWFKKVIITMTDKTKKISEFIRKNYTNFKSHITDDDIEISNMPKYKMINFSNIDDYMKDIVNTFNKIKNNEEIDIEKFTNKEKLKEIDNYLYENKEIKKFTINKNTFITEYLDFCIDSYQSVKALRSIETKNINLCKEAISHLKKLENKPDNYMEKIKYCRQLLVYMQSATNIVVSMMQTMVSNKYRIVINVLKNTQSNEKNNESDNKNKKDDLVSPRFKQNVATGNTDTVRSALVDYLIIDRTFVTFDASSKYAESKIPDLYDKHDGKKFIEDKSKWDMNYLNRVKVDLYFNNFSRERVSHLKQVIQYVIKEK